MRKYVIGIMMTLALGLTDGAAAQSHRHTPRTEQADSAQNSQDGIEAYSDTTSVAGNDTASFDASSSSGSRQITVYADEDASTVVEKVFGALAGGAAIEMVFVLLLCLLLFFLAPIGIIIAIFYFVNKNRRERYKLAQMAMQNGQPIPNEILNPATATSQPGDDYTAGIRQIFLGIGLMFFLGYLIGKVGAGVGALVFFIGLGKVIIAKTSANRNKDIDNLNSLNHD